VDPVCQDYQLDLKHLKGLALVLIGKVVNVFGHPPTVLGQGGKKVFGRLVRGLFGYQSLSLLFEGVSLLLEQLELVGDHLLIQILILQVAD
jgi:hypothetical protein